MLLHPFPAGYDPLIEARSENVDALLKAWSAEIEQESKELDERQKKIDQELIERRAQETRQDREAHFEAAVANAEALRLEGQLGLARSHDGVAVDVSTSAISTRSSIGSEIAAAIASIQRENTEDDPTIPNLPGYSRARDELTQGQLPRPNDLAAVIGKVGVDGEFKALFEDLAQRLAAIKLPDRGRLSLETGADEGGVAPLASYLNLMGRGRGNPQLQAHEAKGVLEVLDAYLDALRAYSPQRLLLLMTAPSALRNVESPPVPALGSMSQRDFAAVMDRFTKR
ncbi:MAG: hypothetical protein IT384_20660 [Deltaproteobacteria bacterium]|nr:hypothetical protein [Deltaproteobacteria bacterium]